MRSAALRLRGAGGTLDAQVVWPAATAAGTLILLVEAGEPAHGEYVSRFMADAAGLVVLNVACGAPGDGTAAIEWTADHAAQLGADQSRLLVAGLHGGADVAATLALQGRDDGWPGIARQILIHPRFAGRPAPLEGLPPAIVVGDSAYAAQLRGAGVEVDELDHPDPFRRPEVPDASADRLLRLLAQRL